jgi:hypothetical protein
MLPTFRAPVGETMGIPKISSKETSMKAKGITVNLDRAMMPEGRSAKDRVIRFDPAFEMFEGGGAVKVLASGHWMLFGRTCFDYAKAACFPILEAAVKEAGAAGAPGRWKWDGGLDTAIEPFPFRQVLPRSGRYGIIDPFKPVVTEIDFSNRWHETITLKASEKRITWDSTTSVVAACDPIEGGDLATTLSLPYFFAFEKLGARLAIFDEPDEDTRLSGILVLHPTDEETWGIVMPIHP